MSYAFRISFPWSFRISQYALVWVVFAHKATHTWWPHILRVLVLQFWKVFFGFPLIVFGFSIFSLLSGSSVSQNGGLIFSCHYPSLLSYLVFLFFLLKDFLYLSAFLLYFKFFCSSILETQKLQRRELGILSQYVKILNQCLCCQLCCSLLTIPWPFILWKSELFSGSARENGSLYI